MKRIGHFLNRTLPMSAGFAVYRLAAKITRGLVEAKTPSGLVWYRNSFVLGTLRPFVSDLDITLWFEKAPSAEELNQAAVTLKTIKIFFPFLGEANVYVAENVRAHGAIANLFEVARDPSLLKRIEAKPLFSVRTMAAVFLCRMIEGDMENVVKKPAERRVKWNSHLAAVESALGAKLRSPWDGFPGRSLLRGLVELIIELAEIGQGGDFQKAVDDLERYFECVARGVPAHVLEVSETLKIFFPHRFCFSQSITVSGNEIRGNRANCLLAELAWELWGQIGQGELMAPSYVARMREHVIAVKRFCAPALAGAAPEVRGALEKISF